MILIVGLGNPGEKFKKTRHNVGFRAIDKIAADFQFPTFNFQSIFNAEISKGEINGQSAVLAKPRTFMNNSGKAVKLLMNSLKLKAENLLVINDDIDVPFGKIKISKNRGSAGHKGVQSIIDNLGTKDFIRLRVGIDQNSKVKNQNFVLEKFNKEEEKIIKEAIKKTANAVEIIVKEGSEKAMSRFNNLL